MSVSVNQNFIIIYLSVIRYIITITTKLLHKVTVITNYYLGDKHDMWPISKKINLFCFRTNTCNKIYEPLTIRYIKKNHVKKSTNVIHFPFSSEVEKE